MSFSINTIIETNMVHQSHNIPWGIFDDIFDMIIQYNNKKYNHKITDEMKLIIRKKLEYCMNKMHDTIEEFSDSIIKNFDKETTESVDGLIYNPDEMKSFYDLLFLPKHHVKNIDLFADPIKWKVNVTCDFDRTSCEFETHGEILKVLILNGNFSSLNNLFKIYKINPSQFFYYGYSNFFNGGIMHILAEALIGYVSIGIIANVDPNYKLSNDNGTLKISPIPVPKLIDFYPAIKAFNKVAGHYVTNINDCHDYRGITTSAKPIAKLYMLRKITQDDTRDLLKYLFKVIYNFNIMMKLAKRHHDIDFDLKYHINECLLHLFDMDRDNDE